MTQTTAVAPVVHPLRSARGLALLGALTGLTPLAIDAYLPALPSMARDLAATDSAVQLTLTALLVGLALGQVVAGPLSDAVGRRLPVLVGMAGFTLASLACIVAPNVEVLVALRFVQGLTGAAGVVCSRAIVRDLYEGVDAARAFARLLLVMGAAPVLAPALGALVLRGTSWRGVFGVLALAGALLLVVGAVMLKETLPPELRRPAGPRSVLRTFGRLLRDRPFVLHALAGGLSFSAMFAYIAGSSFVLQEVYGLSPQEFAAAFALSAGSFVAVSQLGARLVRRFGSRRLLLWGGGQQVTGAAVLTAAVLTDAPLWLVLIGLVLTQAAVGLIGPNATALALADHGAVAGSASALTGMASFVLGGVTAPLVGVGDRPALSMALVMLGAAALGLLSASLVRPRRDPHLTAVDPPVA